MALLTVPFFSLAGFVSDPNSPNIFENGTIDLQEPKSEPSTVLNCGLGTENISVLGTLTELEPMALACRETWTQYIESGSSFCGGTSWESHSRVTYNIRQGSSCGRNELTTASTFYPPSLIEHTESKQCPPDSFPTHTSPYSVGEDFKCYNPAQLDKEDSCNSQSGNEYLTIHVSSPSGCFPQPDGSMCKYDAVDVGGGNEFYALDLEGDCYDKDKDLPSLYGDPQDSPMNEECVDYGGGVLGCPANPSDVCSSGSSFAGGSIQDCNTGCGMVNDQFLCIDQDTDGDGLPDYNDPDIDGDGIANGDDLDSDGDGVDDPINGNSSGGGNGQGTGSGGANSVDLGPVVSELKKANKSLDEITESFSTDHGLSPDELNKDDRITELNNDYKLQMENFIAKGSEELGYVDTITFDNDGFAINLPNDGCTVYTIDVPRFTAYTIDLCQVSARTEPILYWLFAFLTGFYMFVRVNTTLRE